MPHDDLNPTNSNLRVPIVRGKQLSAAKEIQPRIYCAPRRFDILTILCVSSVYAVAFAILTGAKVPMLLTLSLTLFVTFIGLAQAVLWQGKRPRRASILVGIVFFVGWTLLEYSSTQNTIVLRPLLFGGMISVLVGSIIGYVFGAAIGGLFLTIEGVRDSLFVTRKSYARTESSSPYDD